MDQGWCATLLCVGLFSGVLGLLLLVRRGQTRRAWRGGLGPSRRAYEYRKSVAYHEPYDPAEVARRDRYVCYLCGLWVEPEDRTLDHLVPLVMGGADAPWNLHLAHRGCNSAKGGQLLIDLVRRR